MTQKDSAPRLTRAWFGFLIWILYSFGLRRILNQLQRRLKGEHQEARLPLADLRTPDALLAHLRRFEYRSDKMRAGPMTFPIDYISDPRVFEARLRTRNAGDGDCDDFHHYAACQLERMVDVTAAYLVSIGYRGGGHMACVYRFRDQWILMNYQRLHPLGHPNDACKVLLEWAERQNVTGKPLRWRWFLFEDTNLRRVEP